MGPLNVLSLADAKLFLKVDFTDDDSLITGLISAAVSLVEQVTNYRLYNRNEILYTGQICYDAFQYPLVSASVISADSAITTVPTLKQYPQTLRTVLFWGNGFWYTGFNESFFNNDTYWLNNSCPVTYVLTLNVGYTDATLIPTDLITAIKQIITFTYENRDATKLDLPDNIQMLLAPYRRYVTFL